MNYIKIFTYNNFPYGGASANFVRNYARSLAIDEENDVEVVIPRGNFYANKNNITHTRRGEIDKVKYFFPGYMTHPDNSVGSMSDNFLSSVLPFFYLIKAALSGKLDVVVVYNTSLSWTIQFIFAKLLTGKKLITILPEYYKKPEKKISSSMLRWYDFYLGLKYLAPLSDKLITLTSFMRDVMKKRKFQDENILILPNVTDPDVFKSDVIKEIRPGFITIGYCGTPNFKDGIDDLITSFYKLCQLRENVHLLIIGDSMSGKTLIPGLKAKLTQLGIENKVTLTGLVPFEEVTGLLNSCQILTLTRPSGIFAEAGFPTKLGEYFACKKPVLATSVGDLKYYFKNREHILIVNPGDTDAIAQGFSTLIEDKELREKLVQNSYIWVRENLDYKSLSVKLCAFLKFN
jgi:glycosyltransferase involved in cell wall biosynthesis